MPIPPRHPGTPHKPLIHAVALWTALLILLAFAANIIGIYLSGGIVAWSQWLDDHKLHFFVGVSASTPPPPPAGCGLVVG